MGRCHASRTVTRESSMYSGSAAKLSSHWLRETLSFFSTLHRMFAVALIWVRRLAMQRKYRTWFSVSPIHGSAYPCSARVNKQRLASSVCFRKYIIRPIDALHNYVKDTGLKWIPIPICKMMKLYSVFNKV
jgi:hypothetical protein